LWQVQANTQPAPGGLAAFEAIVEALHALRLQHATPGKVPDPEETRFVAHLTAVAAFGDAFVGPRMRQQSGAKEEATRQRFETWLSEMIAFYLKAKA
jgi:hypothetical protein